MKNKYRTALFALLALSMTACIKDGYDYDNCPGEFTIIPVYPEGGTTEPDNTHTTITTPGGETKPIDTGKDKPIDLDEGKSTITTTGGDTENVTTDKNTVTVETNPDGTPKEPGDFSGGYIDVTVDGNTENENIPIQVPVNRQTRPLIIKVRFTGNNVSLVETVSGAVSGIAFSRDLNHGFQPTDREPRHPALQSGSIGYSFGKIAAGGQEFLSESHRLLGIDGDAEQHLTLDILFGGLIHKEYDFDITRAMDEFHITEVTKPWEIEITIHLGADFSATIEDWKAGPDIWMDAEHQP